ncbi:MAG: bacteriochlorophyll 4-vinyl reductase [Pseudomonadota bacterium]
MDARVRDVTTQTARIGPNSVLQLVPLLDEELGTGPREMLLNEAGMTHLPADEGLMEEGPAAALHQAVRARYPDIAPVLTRRAGLHTADYIISHRIPFIVMHLLQHAPPWLSAPLLAKTIERHAWTFAGSGDFRIASKRPLAFELFDNPVVRGEHSDVPLCHWHAAVFQRLFTKLVDPDARVVETHCCAMGHDACRFEVQSAYI